MELADGSAQSWTCIGGAANGGTGGDTLSAVHKLTGAIALGC